MFTYVYLSRSVSACSQMYTYQGLYRHVHRCIPIKVCIGMFTDVYLSRSVSACSQMYTYEGLIDVFNDAGLPRIPVHIGHIFWSRIYMYIACALKSFKNRILCTTDTGSIFFPKSLISLLNNLDKPLYDVTRWWKVDKKKLAPVFFMLFCFNTIVLIDQIGNKKK